MTGPAPDAYPPEVPEHEYLGWTRDQYEVWRARDVLLTPENAAREARAMEDGEIRPGSLVQATRGRWGGGVILVGQLREVGGERVAVEWYDGGTVPLADVEKVGQLERWPDGTPVGDAT